MATKYKDGQSDMWVNLPDSYKELLSKESFDRSKEEGKRVSMGDIIVQAIWERYSDKLKHPQALLRVPKYWGRKL